MRFLKLDFSKVQDFSKVGIEFAMQSTLKVADSHRKLALILKIKCFIKWYRDVSRCVLRTLKGFCMAKSAQNLDVNIVLSKCEFIGVGAFEST